jgi:hypothetical protein
VWNVDENRRTGEDLAGDLINPLRQPAHRRCCLVLCVGASLRRDQSL